MQYSILEVMLIGDCLSKKDKIMEGLINRITASLEIRLPSCTSLRYMSEEKCKIYFDMTDTNRVR